MPPGLLLYKHPPFLPLHSCCCLLLFVFFSLLCVSETIASRFHPPTTLEPQGLKIGLINIACFDWFNINAKIVSH